MWFLLKLLFRVPKDESSITMIEVVKAGLHPTTGQRYVVYSDRPRFRKTRFKLRAFWFDIRRGIYNEYPLCCVIQFSLDNFRRTKHRYPSGLMRGGIHFYNKNKHWAACSLHSGRHPNWEGRTQEELERYHKWREKHDPKSRRA